MTRRWASGVRSAAAKRALPYVRFTRSEIHLFRALIVGLAVFNSSLEQLRSNIDDPFRLVGSKPFQAGFQLVCPHIARGWRHWLEDLNQRSIGASRNQPTP